jgi:transposase-like protein
VDWPRTPVERLQDFRPPFCPRRNCKYHTRPEGFRYQKKGSYSTKRRAVNPRFRCLGCGSSFCLNAYSLNYYRKRPELLRPVAAGLVAGSAHRQLARSLDCAASTVTRISAHLGRHSMLLLLRALTALEGQLEEAVVFDHFETFELTQDLPVGVGTPVGTESWFVYGVDPAPHARTGKRSPVQERRRRRRAKRPTHGGYVGSTGRVLDRLMPLCPEGRSLRLVSDEHPAYGKAVMEHPCSDRIETERHPNPLRGPKGSPRSRAAVARDKAMFPVDLLHGILRHSLAAHKRETIAFGKRLNAIMELMFLAAVWRNFIKGVSERRNDRTTPAMRLGLTDRPWSWRQLLSRRLFPDREGLAGNWLEIYRRDWTTPELPSNTRHRKVFAY